MSGLGQDDFRKLLATPRAVSQQTPRVAQTPRAVANKGKRDADGFLKPEPVKPKKKQWKPANKGEEDAESSGTTYRDRAKERRQGINPDYVETEQMLAVLKASEESQSGVAPTDDVAPPATPGVSYEQSKYLGGDAKHTHMVKGLDYALLEKMQIDLKQQDELEEKQARDYVEQIHGNGQTSFNSTFAANIFDVAVRKAKVQPPLRNEMFISGRMAFSWELGEVDDMGDYVPTSDVPTTMIRSKADLKDYEKHFTVTSNDLVMEKVISIMSSTRTGARGGSTTGTEKRRIKRKDKEKAIAEAEKKKEADAKRAAAQDLVDDGEDEEDIFADAGRDYILEVKDREKIGLNRPTPATTPYFRHDDSAEDDDNDKEPVTDAMEGIVKADQGDDSITKLVAQSVGMLSALEGSEAVQKIVGKLDTESTLEIGPGDLTTSVAAELSSSYVARKRRRVDKLADSAATSDNIHSHVIPSHADDLADLDDSGSDGEVDLTQMDMGVKQNKRRQLQRFDFENEEDWFKYKEEQVHLPKAAFQFGVKASDGRQKSGGKRGGDGGKKNYNAKLNKEFQQLNKVYSDKYGSELSGTTGKGGAKKGKQQKRGK
ncbi:RED-like protein N-terminal region-domain-containing protein [Powellomyces hirtus]|nr:RED-like protein N-terminal region-domain-containing protein [Powellomyces hirtus]